MEKKEQISRSNTDKAMKALNSNVDSVIQALYDKLSTIFPCSWKGNTIVVLNEFIIEPPYVEVKGTGAAAGIERISKIVSFSYSLTTILIETFHKFYSMCFRCSWRVNARS